MSIEINLDVMLAKRKMKLGELSEQVGVSATNLSILKTGKAKAVRFTTLEAICATLDCQPGDILKYVPDAPAKEHGTTAAERIEEPSPDRCTGEESSDGEPPRARPIGNDA